jgi:hypothetical protein
VIQMLVRTKAKTLAATMGCVVLIGGALSVSAVLLAQPPTTAAAAGKPPATQPAAPTANAPAPKQVLHEFAAAVRNGDGERLPALALATTENEKQLIEFASEYVSATGDFRRAVADKFGADAARGFESLFELTPIGRLSLFIETSVDQAPETIEGDSAMIQPPDVEDLTFYLTKDTDGRWKLSIRRMTENWTPEEWEDRAGLIHAAAGALHECAGAVAAGKYASPADLKRDLGPVLRQNR